MFEMLRKGCILLTTVAVFAACSSTTVVRSTDPEARIYIDGEYKGKGSITHSDKKIVGSSTAVRIEKDGCVPQTYSFSRNEEFAVGPCIGGVFLLFPFLWVMEYKPDHTYEYRCQKEGR